MSVILLIVDVIFFFGAAFNVYWQSQIEIRSIYKISSLIFAGFIGAWLLISPTGQLSYVVMVALFMLLNIMNGVGGVGTKKIVLNGFYSGVLDYSQVEHVTLIPIEIQGRKPKVAVIFNTKRPQQVEMNFNISYKDMQKFLDKKLSNEVSVEVGQI